MDCFALVVVMVKMMMALLIGQRPHFHLTAVLHLGRKVIGTNQRSVVRLRVGWLLVFVVEGWL